MKTLPRRVINRHDSLDDSSHFLLRKPRVESFTNHVGRRRRITVGRAAGAVSILVLLFIRFSESPESPPTCLAPGTGAGVRMAAIAAGTARDARVVVFVRSTRSTA